MASDDGNWTGCRMSGCARLLAAANQSNLRDSSFQAIGDVRYHRRERLFPPKASPACNRPAAQFARRKVMRVSSEGRPSLSAKPGHNAVPLLTYSAMPSTS
jgi:hypothetical protein